MRDACAESSAPRISELQSLQQPGTVSAGYGFGVAAYLSWGLLPLYWKLFAGVSPFEVLAHRVIWSFVFSCAVLGASNARGRFLGSVHSVKHLLTYALAATLIAANWGIYIWAVTNNFVLESSLGYFINPLFNVALGCLVFRERLSRRAAAAVCLAAIAVLYLGFSYGKFPWVALGLAATFAAYAVVKKQLHVGPLDGLMFETAILFLPALALASSWGLQGTAEFLTGSPQTSLLLVSTGVITAAPMIWFAFAAQRLPLSTLGMLQYLSPTCQFLLAVTVFGEQISSGRLCAFVLIWLGLALYVSDQWRTRPRPETLL